VSWYHWHTDREADPLAAEDELAQPRRMSDDAPREAWVDAQPELLRRPSAMAAAHHSRTSDDSSRLGAEFANCRLANGTHSTAEWVQPSMPTDEVGGDADSEMGSPL
jgi:hypothetical protein